MAFASELYAAATEALTVDATSGGVRLTLSNLLNTTPPTKAATLTVETAQLRWLKDGTAPTASAGHVANVGSVIFLDNANDLVNFRAIRTGSTSALIRVSYHRGYGKR